MMKAGFKARLPQWIGFAALHAAVAIVWLAPLWLQQIPALTDYPNHLARSYIAFHHDQNAALADAYDVEWKLAPYLGMEGITHALQYITDIYSAGRITLMIALMSIIAGVVAVHYALYRRFSVITFLVYPFLYHFALLAGFVNFTLGIGVALLSLAWWLRRADAPGLRHWGVMAMVLVANYAVHAISSALLIGVLGLLELVRFMHGRPVNWRELARRCALGFAALIPTALLWLQADSRITAVGTHWVSLREHAVGWVASTDFTAMRAEPYMVLLLIGCYGVCFAQMHRRWRWMLAALMVVALCVPTILFGVAFAHIRLPILTAFLLIAGLHWPSSGKAQRAVMTALCLGLLVMALPRQWTIYHNMQFCSGKMLELAQALRQVETIPGMMLTSIRDREGQYEACKPGIHHAATLAAIEKHWFVPEVFTIIPPIAPSAAYKPYERMAELTHKGEEMREALGDGLASDPTKGALAASHYLLWIHYDNAVPDLASLGFDIHARGSYFTLYARDKRRSVP